MAQKSKVKSQKSKIRIAGKRSEVFALGYWEMPILTFALNCCLGAYLSLWFKCSPTRSALAMIVNAGFTAPLETKKLPSTT